jgi:hypothetical protein
MKFIRSIINRVKGILAIDLYQRLLYAFAFILWFLPVLADLFDQLFAHHISQHRENTEIWLFFGGTLFLLAFQTIRNNKVGWILAISLVAFLLLSDVYFSIKSLFRGTFFQNTDLWLLFITWGVPGLSLWILYYMKPQRML